MDADDSGAVEITDGIYLLNFLFYGGPRPAEPFAGCGLSPAGTTLGCEFSYCSGSGSYSPNLSAMPGNQTESAVAIDPLDPTHVVVVSMLWREGVQANGNWGQEPGFFRAVTTDGGKEWTTGVILDDPQEAGEAFADPALAFDGKGNLYLAYGALSPGGLYVAVSPDGGMTFPESLRMLLGEGDRPAIAAGPSSDPSKDSVWVVVRAAAGRIVARGALVSGPVVTKADFCFGGAIEVTSGCSAPCLPCAAGQKCVDGACVECEPGEPCDQPTPPCEPCGVGRTCQAGACVELSGEPLDVCPGTNRRDPPLVEVERADDSDLDCFCNYPDIAVGPGGSVIVAYNNGAYYHPIFQTSPATVFVKRRLPALPDLPGEQEPGFTEVLRVRSNVCGLLEAGYDAFGWDYIPARPRSEKGVVAAPDLAWDRGRNQRVYLAFLDKPTLDQTGNEDHDTNVAFLYADPPYTAWYPREGGVPAPKVVNDDYSVDPPSPVNSQFFQRMAVDQTTGHLALSWYDTRPPVGQPADLEKVRFFATFSTDQGQTFFPSFPLSEEQSAAVTPVMGPAQSTLGDYASLDFHGNAFYPVWADNAESFAGYPDWERINVGGPEVADPEGGVWAADTAYLGQPGGSAFPLETTQDGASVRFRRAPQAVYQTARHSADVPTGAPHALAIPVANGTYDLRFHVSGPTELEPPEPQANHRFKVLVEGWRAIPRDSDQGFEPSVPAGGENRVVTAGVWKREVGGGMLEIRSEPFTAPGDSFELGIELGPSIHSETSTRKVVIEETSP